MNAPIKYVASPPHVKEVSLVGLADLSCWTEKLRTADLAPLSRDGFAQVMIIAANMKFMGIRFSEISVSVLVEDPASNGQAGTFLVGAYCSRRFFAFCERNLFGTPYQFAPVQVSLSPPLAQVEREGITLFKGLLHTSTAGDRLLRDGAEGWSGRVFLPGRGRGKGATPMQQFFFADIHGATQVYRFDPRQDVFVLHGEDGGAFKSLLESRFTPKEWVIREDATHRKSKSHQRPLVISR